MRTKLTPLGLVLLLLLTAAPLSASPKCSGPTGALVGQCAPDFSLKTIDGKEVRLSSYLGKVVFLNFWATWCAPCQVEIPEMIKANEALRSNSFAMLSASIDTEGKPVIEKFFKDNFQGKFPLFTILLDTDKKVSSRYGTFKVPETYIIDRTGRIRDKVEGIKEWSDPMLIHYLELLGQK